MTSGWGYQGGITSRVTTHVHLAPALTTGVPLVLGVTGHREFRPDDVEPLESLVTSVIAGLIHRYGHTPLIVLTPLAEGADRLVAEVALAHGASLVVPLPFARRRYEATFRDEESRRHFTRLVTDPRTLRVMELPELPHTAGPDEIDEATYRRFAYLRCGAFVARHSQLLIALWDGQPAQGTGGTAAVVEYRRTGRLNADPALLRLLKLAPEPFAFPQRPLDAPEFGPVYHIVTPRSGPDQPVPAAALTVRHLALAMYDHHPTLATAYFAELHRQWANVDAYNAALGADVGAGAAANAASSPPERPPTIAALASAGAAAGALARSNQSATYAALRFIFVVVFAAAIAFEGYAHLVKDESVVSLLALAAYVTLIAIAYIRYRRGRMAQTAFQDYRALAEGLRVQLAWRRAGLPHSVADHYLRKHADELTWIRDGVDAWSSCTPPVTPPDLDAAELWIASQEAFYAKAARRDADELARHQQGGVGWVASGLAGATVVAIASPLLKLTGAPTDSVAYAAYFIVMALIAASVVIFVSQGLPRVLAARRGEDHLVSPSDFARLRGGVLMGIVAVVIIVSLPALIELLPARYVPDWLVVEYHPWIVVAFGMVTLAGTFHHAFAEQRAFAEHRNQYERMAKLFERGHAAFTERRAGGDTAGIEELLVALGTEALTEHADWLVLHRERPLQIPKVEI
jgi:hypothetical protein